MPIVDVEGQRFEFPDGTPDDVIGQSIRTFFGDQQPSPQPPIQPPPAQPIQQPQVGVQQDGARIDSSGVAPDSLGSPGQRLEPSFTGSSVIEPIATLLSGAIAEPVAGVAGILQTLNPFVEEGAGAQAVEDVREALTFQPRTQAGQESLQAIGGFLEPVSDALKQAEKTLGDETFKATNSPALAAAATTIPTALLEVLGIASAKGAIKTTGKLQAASQQRQIDRAIVEAAPSIEQLKDVSRGVYKELDDSGVSLQPKAFKGMVNRIDLAVRKAGFDPDLTPKTASVLRRLQSELGKSPTLTEIDTLRKVAQNAAKSIEPADAALGSIVVDNIDSFLDIVSPSAFKKGNLKTSEISGKYQVARDLWGRARRSELINESFEKARNQASGFENGLVTQFRSILNNKKKSRFFKANELDAMKKVVRGTTTENIAKLIGRLGFSEGHATNLIGGSLGIAGGAAIGGPVGAVAVPVIGQVSRKLAQRLTRKNAEFADTVVRAGSNAEAIVSAYLDNTPKKLRTSSELSELLSRPDIALDNLVTAKRPLLREAAEIARGNQILLVASAVPGAIESTTQEQQ